MNASDTLLTWPRDLETWLVLGYALVVLLGAWVTEWLARLHFHRARRYAEQGFRYDHHLDHYHCPEGQPLKLHQIHHETRLAIYQAHAPTCARCPRKPLCTPHEAGRRIFRPLAAWAETDVGRFHQRVAQVMIACAGLIPAAAFLLWIRRPGTGLLLVPFLAAAGNLAFWGRRGMDTLPIPQ